MRRFLITSPKFTGQAEVIYNAASVLCKIDCTDTDMNAVTIKHFKAAVGAEIASIGALLPNCIIVEAEYEVSFEMFFDKYKKKLNKARCILLWSKMSKTMQVQAYHGIDAYEKYLKKEHWMSKAHPETYLRNKYWENEYK